VLDQEVCYKLNSKRYT